MAISTNSSAIKNIQATINGMKSDVAQTKNSVNNIKKVIAARTKVKSEAVFKSKALYQKRLDATRRRDAEDQLEVSNISPALSPTMAVRNSGKGFVGRIISAIGYMTVGWLVNQLPTWIKLAEEFVARTYRLIGLTKEFVNFSYGFIKSFPRIIEAYGKNIMDFDFFDTSGRVKTAFDELNNSMQGMQDSVDEALRLFTTPLSQQEYSGTEDTSQGSQDTSTGTYDPGVTYFSEGGTKITDPGGQDYGVYGAGMMGSRGKARVHGADGKSMGHTGEDYAMPTGTPLTMIAKGTVVDVGMGYNGGYGNFVVVQLDNGMYVKMAHLDKVYVKKGQKVGAGSGPNGTAVVIGTSGMTGLGSGPHLHLDYSKSYDPATAFVSQTVNPKSFIEGGGLVIGTKVRSSGQTRTTSGSSQSQASSGSSSSGSVGTKEQRAMLDAIAFAEGTAKYPNNGYNTHFAGSQFSDFSRHPDKVIRSGRYASAAAGRYQFMPGTFNRLAKKLGLRDFSPASQDKAAIELARELGITQEFLLREGMSFKTSAALGRQWASFPGKSIGLDQPTKGLSGIQNVYRQSLGSGGSRAQISSKPSQSNVTPTNVSEKINVIDTRSQPSQQQQSSGGAGQQIMSTVSSAGNMLNNFIRQKFLTDLSYL